jgi:hypothetical protein
MVSFLFRRVRSLRGKVARRYPHYSMDGLAALLTEAESANDAIVKRISRATVRLVCHLLGEAVTRWQDYPHESGPYSQSFIHDSLGAAELTPAAAPGGSGIV